MAKLHPPHIEGKLPAFTGNILEVPLTMNRAVGFQQVNSMRAIIKTVQTGIEKANIENGSLSADGLSASFSLSEEIVNKLVVGQYYKIQIAYVEKNNNLKGDTGYYSNIGIAKYTKKPNIYIEGLDDNKYTSGDFVGVYDQTEGDDTEKIYSYCFTITDSNDNIVATSGEQLHNSSEDNDLKITKDNWKYYREFEKEKNYYITYQVTSMNGLTLSTKKYNIKNKDTIDANIQAHLITSMDYDEGCISLFLEPTIKSNQDDIILTGNFVLTRASSLENFKNWEEIYRFNYNNLNLTNKKSVLVWEDYTIQQGVEYVYALQMFNKNYLYSTKIYGINNTEDKKERVLADFEDAFLSDSERQLKIRFNPKIASFKNTILESKVDTIGGHYPFIFRNGNIHYKEFSISGLISMLSDPQSKFLSGIQSVDRFTDRISTPSFENPPSSLDTMLTSDNIYRERKFKMEVLEWLNNGKPKIFRSPTEGNFIVRLMNISLTPNDTLGRMLHTFQSTAYEIADYNLTTLKDLELIKIEEKYASLLKMGQVKIDHVINTDNITHEKYYQEVFGINRDTQILEMKQELIKAEILNAPSNLIVTLIFKDGHQASVEIGGTGSYIIPIDKNNPLFRIKLESVDKGWGDTMLSFVYKSNDIQNSFNIVTNLTSTNEIRQCIGTDFNTDVIADMSDIRTEVKEFPFMRINKRYIQPVYLHREANKPDKYYRYKGNVDLVAPPYNKTTIYYEISDYDKEGEPLRGKFWDPNTWSYLLGSPDYRFAINCDNYLTDYIDFEGRKDLDNTDGWGDTHGRIDALRNLEKIDNLHIGNGLIVDMVYDIKTKEFEVEENNSKVKTAKENWKTAQKNGFYYEEVVYKDAAAFSSDTRDKYIKDGDNFIKNTQTFNNKQTYYVKINIDTAYQKFIKELEKALQSYK